MMPLDERKTVRTRRSPLTLQRIVSGGQTGVDRAALDVAIELGISCGGWCPQGRRAEDGRIPDRYPLRETASDDYAARTRANVRDSDATLILTVGEPAGGTALTMQHAEVLGRPVRLVDLDGADDIPAVSRWIEENRVSKLNIAGPRESTAPGVYERARSFLRLLLPAVTGR